MKKSKLIRIQQAALGLLLVAGVVMGVATPGVDDTALVLTCWSSWTSSVCSAAAVLTLLTRRTDDTDN